MSLTPEEVHKIATLARLKLTEEEVALYQHQLADVLGYIDQLAQADVSDVEGTAQVTGLTTVLADDVVVPSEARDTLLKNAPNQANGLIKVRAVFGGDS